MSANGAMNAGFGGYLGFSEMESQMEEEKYEATLEFIQAVQGQPCLWDSGVPEYQNRAAKKNAYKHLADRFQITEVEVERKWRNLRSYYTQLLAKVTKSRSSGLHDADSDSYLPKWPFYIALSFLHNIIQPKKNLPYASNSIYSLPQDTGTGELLSLVTDMGSLPTQVCKRIKLSPSDDSLELNQQPSMACSPVSGVNTPPPVPISAPPPSAVPSTHSQYRNSSQYLTGVSSGGGINSYRAMINTQQSEGATPNDEWSLFGKLIASDLRKMPKNRQYEVRYQIQSLLYREMTSTNGESSSQSTSSNDIFSNGKLTVPSDNSR